MGTMAGIWRPGAGPGHWMRALVVTRASLIDVPRVAGDEGKGRQCVFEEERRVKQQRDRRCLWWLNWKQKQHLHSS